MILRRVTTALLVAPLIALGVLVAAPATQSARAVGALEFVQPSGTHLAGTTDLEVTAPADTTAVRFYLDDVQLSEVTDLYARQTRTTPTWRTATDVGWFPSGAHVLRAEAQTPSGVQSTSRKVVTSAAPQAPGVSNLNGEWRFRPAAELPQGAADGDRPAAAQPGFDAGTWARIVVPDSFGAVRDAWNDDAGLLGVYRRAVELDQPAAAERTALVFESCFWSCRYFVNGTEVGSSVGGYLPTRLDVTSAVHAGSNTVAVIVDNRTSTMGGYARPVQGLYWNFGGLLQQVRLERTPAVSLVETRAEGTAAGALTLRPTGVNATSTAQRVDAMVTVDGPDGRPLMGPTKVSTSVPPGGGPASPITLQVPSPQLWDLDHPNLYTVHLRPQGDAAWHELVEQTGFRDVTVKGLDLLLNGKPVQDLQGFNRHADYPGLGRTQPDGLSDREIKALHDKGFRLFRPAHYPTTPAELHAADVYGLLVIEEVNNISSQPASFLAQPDVQQFGKTTLTRMVARDRSHPSLFAWSVGNENATDSDGGVDYVRNVIGYGRTVDPSRLYTHVSNRSTRDRAYPYQDFFATNYYAGWYATLDSLQSHLDAVQKMAKMPILLSEYGAEAVYQRPGTGRGTEYYQAQVVDEHNRLLAGRAHLIGKMYWTSTEFWCTPTWGSGQTPDPVPPFHTKGLETWFRDHKLGWRVMFSPVRITRSTVLQAPVGQRVTLQEKVTISDVRGTGAAGNVVVEPPSGFTAGTAAFSVPPGGSTTVTVPLTGTLQRDATTSQGFVRAVVDADTEALPVPLSVRATDTVTSPASDSFASSDLDPAWQVIRPDGSGWSLQDKPGSLRLSTLPGGETGATNDGRNLFVRDTTPQTDLTAEATVSASDAAADFQQIGLLAYVDDDNYVKLGLGWIDGRRALELVAESGGRIAQRKSIPYDGTSARLRLVQRQGTVAAEYSSDGLDWYAVGDATLAGSRHLALQAVGGSTAPPVVATYVDDLVVRTSGLVTADSVSVPSQPLFTGRAAEADVAVTNASDHPVQVEAGLTVPPGWTSETKAASVPAFGSVTVPLQLTAQGPPTSATISAKVTGPGVEVRGAPATDVLTAPPGDSVSLALDAGTTSSPLLGGYQRLSPSNVWDGTSRYGWVGTPPLSRDRGGLDPLAQDIVTGTAPGTLRVAVPAGRHDVDLLIGDRSFAADAMTVSTGGQTVLSLDTPLPRGSFRWFRFSVDGGPSGRAVDLQLAAQQDGGYWRFAGLAVG